MFSQKLKAGTTSESKTELQPIRVKITEAGVKAAMDAAQTEGTLKEIILEATDLEITYSSATSIAGIITLMPVVEIKFINCKIQNLEIIIQALGISHSLQRINFSSTQFNASQMKLLLNSLARQQTLVSLDLTNTFNIFDKEEPEQKSEQVQKTELKIKKKSFHLFGWSSLVTSVKREAVFISYKSAAEKHTQLTKQFYEIFDSFREFLKTNQMLRMLNISNNILQSPRNGIADRCMQRFSEGLKSNTSLTTLICNSNDISVHVIAHVLEAMEKNPQLILKNLMLNNNDLNHAGVRKISETLALPTCPIETLDVSNNPMILPLALVSIKVALVKNPKSLLKALDLHQDKIAEDSAVDAATAVTTREFALELKDNITLKVVNIDGVPCPELVALLKRNNPTITSEIENIQPLNASALRL